jgi:hypothetical protein
MSQPREPDPVKLVASLFSPQTDLVESVIEELAEMFGPVDFVGPQIPFDRTTYYAREMGWPLYRRFVSFENLVAAEQLPLLKLKTNQVEQRHLHEGRRQVNIDPGYLSPERLILATGKNYVHRVYLSAGIYADLTLLFQRGTFAALGWTYPDYRDPDTIQLFNGIRKTYMGQLKEMKRFD